MNKEQQKAIIDKAKAKKAKAVTDKKVVKK